MNLILGKVVDNVDPDGMGRIQVELPDYSGEVTLPWLSVLQPFASADLGVFVLPDLEDHVVCAPGPGGVSGLIVLGSLYSGTRLPPALNAGDPSAPAIRGIVTASGSEITIDDTDGAEQILIQTSEGSVQVLLDNAETTLTLTGKTEIALNSETKIVVNSDADVEVGGAPITIKSTGDVTVEGVNVTVSGSAGVTIDSPSVEIA